MAFEIGKVTAAAALSDELEAELAELTGLAVSTVRRRLRRATGNTHVRNVLDSRWPWDADSLGDFNVSKARRWGLIDELMHVTSRSRRSVRAALRKQHGRTLLKNAFAKDWPEEGWDDEDFVEDEWDDWDDTASDEVLLGGDDDDQQEEEVASSHATGRKRLRTAVAGSTPPTRFRGERIANRFQLGRRLGKGGFGEVFEAYDDDLGRAVVVKFAHNDDIDVLRHEFAQVFELSHPHICRVNFHRDQSTGRAFLVMQHGGSSVQQLIRERGAFPVGDAAEIVRQVAHALDFAHEHNVIHYDVSPGNVLVDEHGTARLTDFGVAVAGTMRLSTTGHETLLAATAIGYNPVYAAPEMRMYQARRASDQFSLALVFCAMVDGKLFTRVPPYRQRRRLNPAQNEAVQIATALDPKNRYERCSDFARALLGEPEAAPIPGSTSLLS